MSLADPPVSLPYDTSTGYSSATHGWRSRLTSLLTWGSVLTSSTALAMFLRISVGTAATEAEIVGRETEPAGPSARAPVPRVPLPALKSLRAVITPPAVITAFRTWPVPDGPGP